MVDAGARGQTATQINRVLRAPSAAALAASNATLAARLAAATKPPSPLILRMPKLHLTTQTNLVQVLSTLGMPIAFSGGADFSGITAKPSLAIGTVEHATDISVDEQGTVAAAATAVGLSGAEAPPARTVNLTIDHPFLLFLRDHQTSAILFAARESDPTRS
jgi:serine protease inhibitor